MNGQKDRKEPKIASNKRQPPEQSSSTSSHADDLRGPQVHPLKSVTLPTQNDSRPHRRAKRFLWPTISVVSLTAGFLAISAFFVVQATIGKKPGLQALRARLPFEVMHSAVQKDVWGISGGLRVRHSPESLPAAGTIHAALNLWMQNRRDSASAAMGEPQKPKIFRFENYSERFRLRLTAWELIHVMRLQSSDAGELLVRSTFPLLGGASPTRVQFKYRSSPELSPDVDQPGQSADGFLHLAYTVTGDMRHPLDLTKRHGTVQVVAETKENGTLGPLGGIDGRASSAKHFAEGRGSAELHIKGSIVRIAKAVFRTAAHEAKLSGSLQLENPLEASALDLVADMRERRATSGRTNRQSSSARRYFIMGFLGNPDTLTQAEVEFRQSADYRYVDEFIGDCFREEYLRSEAFAARFGTRPASGGPMVVPLDCHVAAFSRPGQFMDYKFTPADAKGKVRLGKVGPGSLPEKLGLHVGDVVLSVDGEPMWDTDVEAFAAQIAAGNPLTTLQARPTRSKKRVHGKKKISIVRVIGWQDLQERGQADPWRSLMRSAVNMQDVTISREDVDRGLGESLAQLLDPKRVMVRVINDAVSGIEFRRLTRGDLLAKVGLEDGDVLVALDTQATNTLEKGLSSLQIFDSELQEFPLLWVRDGVPMGVKVRIQDASEPESPESSLDAKKLAH